MDIIWHSMLKITQLGENNSQKIILINFNKKKLGIKNIKPQEKNKKKFYLLQNN